MITSIIKRKRMPRKIKKAIKKLWENYHGCKVKCKNKTYFIRIKK